MANSYAALGESQAQTAVTGKQKGVALLSFVMGVGFAVFLFGGAAQQQEPISAVSMPMQAWAPAAVARTPAALRGTAAPAWHLTHPMHLRHTAHPFRNVRAFDASPVVSDLLEKIKGLTLLEASELVKEMEETFGIDASAGGGMMMMAPGAGAPGAAAEAAEEKTTFDVVLEAVDDSKRVAALKAIRAITGLGLKEAKDFLTAVPKVVKEGVSKEDAEAAQKDLEAVGAKVAVK